MDRKIDRVKFFFDTYKTMQSNKFDDVYDSLSEEEVEVLMNCMTAFTKLTQRLSKLLIS